VRQSVLPAFQSDELKNLPGRSLAVAGGALAADLVASPFLFYQAALRCQATDGEVLATIKEPYFDRTYAHYCSHRNTPNRLEDAPHAGAVRKGRVVFLPHRVGANYDRLGARLHRDLFLNALRLVYHNPTLTTRLPSAGRANLLHQADQRRYVAHLMYAPALKRGECLVIEDLVPLYNVPVTLRVPETVQRVTLAPWGVPVPFERAGGAVKVVVPRMECHQAVVFEY
jgi:hypothetical protein